MELTQDEADLYDRQIRLWGLNAQTRLRQSKVLLIGFGGVASEVAKILALAGIGSLTINDNLPLQATDLTSNIFCREPQEAPFRTSSVEEKLRTLNPLVKVTIDNGSIKKETEYYKSFNLVVLTSFQTIDDICSINDICRELQIKFYLVLDFGYFGFMFSDLGKEFKFSYEEFVNKAEEKKAATSGKLAQNENDGCGSSADDEDLSEDGRSRTTKPKKKRRINSPVRETIKLDSKSEDERQTKMCSLTYATFSEMISMENTDLGKQTTPALLVALAMIRFFDEQRHLPRLLDDQSIDNNDIMELQKNLEAVKQSSNVPESVLSRLDPEWHMYISGSLSPVCAIVGGIAGQDMIRALSNKDIPIINTFSFDGLNMIGRVEKIGISDYDKHQVKPVIRDDIVISSDDDE